MRKPGAARPRRAGVALVFLVLGVLLLLAAVRAVCGGEQFGLYGDGRHFAGIGVSHGHLFVCLAAIVGPINDLKVDYCGSATEWPRWTLMWRDGLGAYGENLGPRPDPPFPPFGNGDADKAGAWIGRDDKGRPIAVFLQALLFGFSAGPSTDGNEDGPNRRFVYCRDPAMVVQADASWTVLASAGLLALLPAGLGRLRRSRRERYERQGLCVNCGYDLRGGSGRCPECGRDK